VSVVDVRVVTSARGRRLQGWQGHRADDVNHAPREDCGPRLPADEDHNKRALLHGLCDSPFHAPPLSLRHSQPHATLPRAALPEHALLRARHLQPPVPRIWHSRPTRQQVPPMSQSARPASRLNVRLNLAGRPISLVESMSYSLSSHLSRVHNVPGHRPWLVVLTPVRGRQ